MRTLLNVIWLVLAGFWLFLGYLAAAALWCITIIGIPFGIASFRIGLYALWPFGRTVVAKPGAGAGSLIGNILWIILSGIWLAIGHAVSGVLLCLTIIGIPLGLANFKMIPISLTPLGKEIVDLDDPRATYAAG
ncbi:YccF domain-containing protein [Nocardioides sp. GY 10113]|uniref:YccF domain-containing protein n=1 Tax=Nocardioides sp. GY 10113 TaxID=2569761 RepID=UPI0010A7F7CF|nr:YccF domain-containing protein [Nocardioides sp. GY 10113]TIC82214.1 YccF domain-containing protein [Nocardioides sp. GY 10113]